MGSEAVGTLNFRYYPKSDGQTTHHSLLKLARFQEKTADMLRYEDYYSTKLEYPSNNSRARYGDRNTGNQGGSRFGNTGGSRFGNRTSGNSGGSRFGGGGTGSGSRFGNSGGGSRFGNRGGTSGSRFGNTGGGSRFGNTGNQGGSRFGSGSRFGNRGGDGNTGGSRFGNRNSGSNTGGSRFGSGSRFGNRGGDGNTGGSRFGGGNTGGSRFGSGSRFGNRNAGGGNTGGSRFGSGSRFGNRNSGGDSGTGGSRFGSGSRFGNRNTGGGNTGGSRFGSGSRFGNRNSGGDSGSGGSRFGSGSRFGNRGGGDSGSGGSRFGSGSRFGNRGGTGTGTGGSRFGNRGGSTGGSRFGSGSRFGNRGGSDSGGGSRFGSRFGNRSGNNDSGGSRFRFGNRNNNNNNNGNNNNQQNEDQIAANPYLIKFSKKLGSKDEKAIVLDKASVPNPKVPPRYKRPSSKLQLHKPKKDSVETLKETPWIHSLVKKSGMSGDQLNKVVHDKSVVLMRNNLLDGVVFEMPKLPEQSVVETNENSSFLFTNRTFDNSSFWHNTSRVGAGNITRNSIVKDSLFFADQTNSNVSRLKDTFLGAKEKEKTVITPNLAPTKGDPSLKCVPPIAVLRTYSQQQLKSVHNFTVIHVEFGAVTWLEPVDLTSVLIDKVLHFSYGNCDLYPTMSKDQKPKQGLGLNKRALIRYFRVFPERNAKAFLGKDRESAVADWKKKLEKACERTPGASFLGYDVLTGEWKVEVEKFY